MEKGLREAGPVTISLGEGVDGLAGDALEKAGFDGLIDSGSSRGSF